jgi:MFS superfamily sulfate permease-like transporter
MMSLSGAVGWLLIVVAMYAGAAAIVASFNALARVARPSLYVPKPILRGCTIALAIVIWYAIPLLVHARFGRATY